MSVFLRSLVLGFSIAAPVGPIGVLVIRRSLALGRLAGLATGLGAATADATYGAIGTLGLTALTSALVRWQSWTQLLGGGFLLWLGWRTARAQPATSAAPLAARSYWGAYASAVGLTLTNPLTILSFGVMFASFGLPQRSAAGWMVAGVFCGSALWWLLLSFGVALLRGRLDTRRLRWINWAAGGLLAGFGLVALLALLA